MPTQAGNFKAGDRVRATPNYESSYPYIYEIETVVDRYTVTLRMVDAVGRFIRYQNWDIEYLILESDGELGPVPTKGWFYQCCGWNMDKEHKTWCITRLTPIIH